MIVDDQGLVVRRSQLAALMKGLQLSRRWMVLDEVDGFRQTARWGTTWQIAPQLWVIGGVPPEFVAGQAGRRYVVLNPDDNTMMDATVVHTSETSVGILKTERAGGECLPLEASTQTQDFGQGAWVIGAQPSTETVVSIGKLVRVENKLVLHTAPTEGGSSGGALLDERGRVIGVHIGFEQINGGYVNKALRIPALLDELAEQARPLLDQILDAHGLQSPFPVEVAAPPTPPEDPQLTALRQAAAVLWAFDPSTLRPYPAAGHAQSESKAGGAWSLLLDEVEPRLVQGQIAWLLKQRARQQGLRQLGSATALRAARAANPDEVVPEAFRPAQTVMDGLLASPPTLDVAPDALSWLATAADWYRPYLPDLPPFEQIDRRRRRAELLMPLRQLAGDDFAGRTDELLKITAWAAVDDLDAKVGPLVLTGAGGAGKSAIVAHFIRTRADIENPRHPFAVLDFDRPGLRLSAPLTLSVEVGRQLALQDALPQPGAWQSVLTEAEAALEAADEAASAEVLDEVMTRIGRGLAEQLRATEFPARGPPLLLFLDSFEEIQPSAGPVPSEVSAFLRAVQGAWPPLRVVVGSRSDVGELGLEGAPSVLCIEELDDESSRAILTARHVDDRDHDLIVELARGNPLALRLAGDLSQQVRGRGAELPADALSGQLVDGVLYRRILDHLWDEEVEQIARPGLVLRVVSAALIQHVLAEPAGMSDVDEARAKALFTQMADVGSLARLETDRIRFRSDVRRMVLHLIEAEDPQMVASVEDAAIAWYRGLYAPRSWQSAELLYHLLRRVTDRNQWAEVWRPELAKYFTVTDGEDLPDAARSWLISRVGGRVPKAYVEAADQLHLLRRQLESALRKDDRKALVAAADGASAVDVSAEQGELRYLQALIYLRLGRYDEAQASIGEVQPADDLMTGRLALIRAEVLEHSGDGGARVATLLDEVATAWILMSMPLTMGLSTHRLLVQSLDPKEAESERAKLNKALDTVASGAFPDDLLRYAAAAATPQNPGPLWNALRIAGAPRWTPELVSEQLGQDERVEPMLRSFAQLAVRTYSGLKFISEDEEDWLVQAIVSLQRLSPRAWEREIRMAPEVVVFFAQLTEYTLRPTIYRRFRAHNLGSEEAFSR